MEVHHHSHMQGKLTWKSYLKEFFMLFLAVLCGFMAEWQLEHLIENQREKEYIQSFVQDLADDIEQSNSKLDLLDQRIKRVDSLLTELKNPKVSTDSKKAFKLWNSSIGFPDFVTNDRTIQQLKSSGSLRLIRKKEVSNKIMEYDQSTRQLNITQQNLNDFIMNNELLFNSFQSIILEQNSNSIEKVPLTNFGKENINNLYSNRKFWRMLLNSLQKRLLIVNEEAKESLMFIKQEYGLK